MLQGYKKKNAHNHKKIMKEDAYGVIVSTIQEVGVITIKKRETEGWYSSKMVRFILLKLDYLSELTLEEVVWEGSWKMRKQLGHKLSINEQLQSSMLVKEDLNLNFGHVF